MHRATILPLLLLAACGQRPGSVVVGAGGRGGEIGGGGSGGEGGSGGFYNCDGDHDGDGFLNASCGGNDCNDKNPNVYPGAAEICGNGSDDDCDGQVDEGCVCKPGEYQSCWPGLPENNEVGACHVGWERCGEDGKWGPCTDAVLPTPDLTCDGIDQACRGFPDGGLQNACGECGPLPSEICGNGIDDDCNGIIDDPEVCTVSCKGIDADHPVAGMECCYEAPDTGAPSCHPVPLTFTCVDAPGLPPCIGDPATSQACVSSGGADCQRRCVDGDHNGVIDRCLCGLRPRDDSALPIESPSCGFETACSHVACVPGQTSVCYSGPPATLGRGICHGGTATCILVGGPALPSWGTCLGEQLPKVEGCFNGEDDDCDGLVDENDGFTGRACSPGDCAPDVVELCGDGIDNDCDGFVDEGCEATAEYQACYVGIGGTRDVGACKDGIQGREGATWGLCLGSVGPSPERCGDGIDSDCNGYGGPGEPEDPGCCVPQAEICGNGIDDDCDGFVDEDCCP